MGSGLWVAYSLPYWGMGFLCNPKGGLHTPSSMKIAAQLFDPVTIIAGVILIFVFTHLMHIYISVPKKLSDSVQTRQMEKNSLLGLTGLKAAYSMCHGFKF